MLYGIAGLLHVWTSSERQTSTASRLVWQRQHKRHAMRLAPGGLAWAGPGASDAKRPSGVVLTRPARLTRRARLAGLATLG